MMGELGAWSWSGETSARRTAVMIDVKSVASTKPSRSRS